MTSFRLTLLVCAAAGTLLLVGRPLIAAAPGREGAVAADKYFGCPTGYAFQTSGNNARCYLAGSAATANIVCGLNWVKAIDQFNGGRDACQYQLTNAVGNYTCPNGFSPQVQAGPDICVKPATPSILAPTIEKSI